MQWKPTTQLEISEKKYQMIKRLLIGIISLFLLLYLMSCTRIEYVKPIAPDCGVIETNGDLLDCYIKQRKTLKINFEGFVQEMDRRPSQEQS